MPIPRNIPPSGSVNKMTAITPSDSVDNIPANTRGLILGTAGALRITFVDETTATINLPAGIIPLVDARRVLATGTTATGIVALHDV